MDWTAFDWLLAAALLALLVGLPALVWRASADRRYRRGALVAALACVLLVWVTGAVGIVGSEDEPLNLAFIALAGAAALAIAVLRRDPARLARLMTALAAAQVAIGAAALVLGRGTGSALWPVDILGGTAVFAALWLLAADGFRRARPPLGA